MHHAHPTAHVACALAVVVAAFDASKSAKNAVSADAAPEFALHVSPDERWLSVSWTAAGVHAWAVPLSDGEARELAQVADNGAATLAWDAESRLRYEWIDLKQGWRELRWLDPQSGAIERFTRDRESIRTELRTPQVAWATVDERRSSSGKLTRTVQWRAQKRKLEIVTQGESTLQIVDAPGVLFYSEREIDHVRVFRCDVASGARREVARSSAPVLRWSATEDGRELLVCESGADQRARVVDAAQGTLIDGPWGFAEARWLDPRSGRYIAVSDGARLYLIDTLRDLELATSFTQWPWMHALADGRFLVAESGEVRIYDNALQPLGTLFAPLALHPKVDAR
jgi:hypothetical protein